jgi:putative DNA primase/helicase
MNARGKIEGVLAGAERISKRMPVHDGVVLICGDNLTPQPIAWLWHGWLALGKFHLLAGAPGQGKTTIAIAFAATITIGGRWPDGSRCDPGNVLIWSGEDDPSRHAAAAPAGGRWLIHSRVQFFVRRHAHRWRDPIV